MKKIIEPKLTDDQLVKAKDGIVYAQEYEVKESEGGIEYHTGKLKYDDYPNSDMDMSNLLDEVYEEIQKQPEEQIKYIGEVWSDVLVQLKSITKDMKLIIKLLLYELRNKFTEYVEKISKFINKL